MHVKWAVFLVDSIMRNMSENTKTIVSDLAKATLILTVNERMISNLYNLVYVFVFANIHNYLPLQWAYWVFRHNVWILFQKFECFEHMKVKMNHNKNWHLEILTQFLNFWLRYSFYDAFTIYALCTKLNRKTAH